MRNIRRYARQVAARWRASRLTNALLRRKMSKDPRPGR
jgi:hypothetical protein